MLEIINIIVFCSNSLYEYLISRALIQLYVIGKLSPSILKLITYNG